MRVLLTKVFLLFVFVQLLALSIGTIFTAQAISVVENPASTDNSFYFFGIIILFAVILLVILKYYHGKLLFQILELAMQFTAVQILANNFVNELIATGIALVTIAVRLKWKETKQFFLLITVAVVGALLGASLDVLPGAILAILLSTYDVIAVFYTKHMVTLAKKLTKQEGAFSIKVQEKKEKLELGTGDLVIPAMLIVSANKIGVKIIETQFGWLTSPSLAALIGACIGIAALLVFLEKHKGYWPALPPITIGTLIGIGIVSLF